MRTICLLVLINALAVATSLAQGISGSVRGQVLDVTGGAITDAAVVLVNIDTSVSAATITDQRGLYAFPRVHPGRYRVEVTRDGFASAVASNVVVAINEAAAVNLVLELGSVAMAVEVHGGQSMLQTQGVELSGLVNEQRVRELPLNGKNFQRLVFTAAGASVGAGADSNPAISGIRRTHNNYSIDGMSFNNERLPNGIAGVNGLGSDFLTDLPNLVSTEAIQEFRIISANADATFGRSSGGQINIVTKSGTNHLRASAYEFARHNALDAKDFFNRGPFFDDHGEPVVPPFHQSLFGATVGGPIRAGRHFYFGNYEGLRQNRREQSAFSTVVPNADLIHLVPGDLGRFFRAFFFDRGIVPTSGNPGGAFSPLSPAERSLALASGFAPHLFDGAADNGEAGTVLISAAPRRDIRQDAFLVRTDHQLSPALAAAVRFGFADSTTLSGNSAIDTDRSQADKRYQSGLLQLTLVVSSRQLVETRVGFQRNAFQSQIEGGLDPRLARLGISPAFGLLVRLASPALTVGTGSTFTDSQTTPQLSLLHHWSDGAVTVRTGLDARLYRVDVSNLNAAQPQFTFASIVGPTGFIGETPNQAQSVATSATLSAFGNAGGPATPLRNYRSGQLEAFTQIDWRVHADVTLNAGVRYAVFERYREQHDALSNLYLTLPSGDIDSRRSTNVLGPSGAAVALTSDATPYYLADRNNWQPRLGVAWNLGNRGRQVLRAGYGIFHDRLIQIQFSSAVTNPPLAAASSAANVPFLLDTSVPLSIAQFPSITAVDPTLVNPWTEHFNLAVEQRIGSASRLTVAYVGSRGHDLFATTQPNGGAGVPQALRPNPRFSRVMLVDNLARSRYHSLQVTGAFRRSWFDLTTAYTLASAKDHASTEFRVLDTLANLGASPAAGFQGGGGQFVRIPVDFDWGPADFDVRQTLSASYLIPLPVGRGRRFLASSSSFVDAIVGQWSLAGLVTWRSGEPVNITLGRDANDDGEVGNDRPLLLSGTIADLYAHGRLGRTQYLLPQAEALKRLGAAPGPDPTQWLGRNALRAPSVQVFDISLIRHIRPTSRTPLSVELNVFNLLNHPNFGPPIGNLADTRFGQLVATRAGTNPRQIQLGIKATF